MTAAWIDGPASGCASSQAPILPKSGWPVSGSGLRARVNSMKSSGVRAKKHGRLSPMTSVREPSGR